MRQSALVIRHERMVALGQMSRVRRRRCVATADPREMDQNARRVLKQFVAVTVRARIRATREHIPDVILYS